MILNIKSAENTVVSIFLIADDVNVKWWCFVCVLVFFFSIKHVKLYSNAVIALYRWINAKET